MQNFNDIKPIILWSLINITNTILFIIFLIVLYFVYKKIKSGQTHRSAPTKNVGVIPCVHPDKFLKDLKNLEKKYLKENKDIFYPKLSEILKNIFEYKTKKDISKLTLSEIKKLLSTEGFNPLKDLISNIYFKEYAKQIDDSEEIRKDLILEIKKLIK